MKKKWLTSLSFIFIVLAITSIFTTQGILRPLELRLYDILIRLRSSENGDQRITIVGITDQDIDGYGVTIPDNILSRLIEQISQHNPEVIGIDLHRNQPTGEGYRKLNQVLRTTPGIVGVEKTNHGFFDFPAIKPNIILEERGMSSASDLIEDDGDVVRRGYLYVSKDRKSSEQIPSFGLKVALEYLEQDQTFPTSSDPENHYLKLNTVIFPRLRNNLFFYDEEDIDDYQILINYRNSAPSFQKISLENILENDFDPSLIKNRIVLIGLIAPSLEDDVSTPLSRNRSNYTQEKFGVEVHAYQASQVISAVKDGREIIKFYPPIIEYFWVMIWIILPSFFLVYQLYFKTKLFKVLIKYTIVNISALLLILIVGYISIIFGYWIPSVTPCFSLIVNFILGSIYIEIIKEKQISNHLDLELKSKVIELEKVQQELIIKEKIKAYGDFSVKMAHEIGNILNIIKLANDNSLDKFKIVNQLIEENYFLFDDLDKDDNHPQKIVQFINNRFSKIDKAIIKASQITNTVRSEYKLNSELQTSIDLNEFIKNIVQDAHWRKEENNQSKNVEVKLNLSSEISIVKIFQMGLESVLLNLLSNASYSVNHKLLTVENINYCPLITISTIDYPSNIEIKVRDNGEGINQDDLEQIFNPFWTTKRAADGIGVGLFFCKQNVLKHNGKISVYSESGKWTEFVICLPKF